MKTALLLSLVLAFSAQAKMEDHIIECIGMTHERDIYTLTTEYSIDSALMECEVPCMVKIKNGHAHTTLQVDRKGKRIHQETFNLPHFVFHLKDDQTTYQFYDEQDNFLDIVPWVGDMSKVTDQLSFQLGKANGEFGNAVCSFLSKGGKI